MSVRIIHGDCMTVLPQLAADSVQCVVTSPPYYGLRNYGVAEQIGLEATPDEYVAKMDVAVQHKGCIVAGFEIVHRHDLHENKRQMLTRLDCSTYVISADWILSQIAHPERLVVMEAINHNPRLADVVVAGRPMKVRP